MVLVSSLDSPSQIDPLVSCDFALSVGAARIADVSLLVSTALSQLVQVWDSYLHFSHLAWRRAPSEVWCHI